MTNSMRYGGGWLAAVGALSMLAGSASAQVEKDQQICIYTMNKDGAGVAAAQGKNNVTCVKNAGRGRESDPLECLTRDDKARVAKAQTRTVNHELSRCTVPPSFGFTGAANVNQVAVDAELALIDDVFGPDFNGAVLALGTSATPPGDSARAACQRQVVRAYERVASAKVKAFAGCKKSRLKDGTISDATSLEACLGFDLGGRIFKAIQKLADTVARRCQGIDLAAAFPGGCPPLDFATCVDQRVECRVCLMLNAMDAMNADCDLFDDGVPNGTCVAPSPSGAFLDATDGLLD